MGKNHKGLVVKPQLVRLRVLSPGTLFVTDKKSYSLRIVYLVTPKSHKKQLYPRLRNPDYYGLFTPKQLVQVVVSVGRKPKR